MIIFKDNDNLIQAVGLYVIDSNGDKDFLDSGATVQVTLSIDGVNVVGETWPLSLTYIPNTDGDFQAVLKDTLTLTLGKICKAVLTVDNGANQRAEFTHDLLIQTRQF